MAGEEIVIGSRNAERAQETAAELLEILPDGRIIGTENNTAAKLSEIVFIAVPFEGHKDTLFALKNTLGGKIVVDVVAPLSFCKGIATATAVLEGSAALQAKTILTESTVVAAFQNVSAHHLLNLSHPVNSDVIVCSDEADARSDIIRLASRIDGVRGINGGGLLNAVYIENFTAMLINLNGIYKTHSSLKISGV